MTVGAAALPEGLADPACPATRPAGSIRSVDDREPARPRVLLGDLEPMVRVGMTRVLLDASDGTDTWGAIGVSENVIEASWEALVDSLEAGMLPGRVQHARDRATQGAPSR